MKLVPRLSHVLLPLMLAVAASVAACQGCHSSTPQPQALSTTALPPTLRLYLVSNLAGGLEPCGCSKNQLGGVDHLGAYLRAQQAQAPDSLLAAVGPTYFLDPVLQGEQTTQDRWKAEALATALQKMNLVAWAPGANDWADGAPTLNRLRELSGAKLLAANLRGATAGAVATTLREIHGIKVGFIGLSAPLRTGFPPEGVEIDPPTSLLKKEIDTLQGQGAQVLVGLFALPRGDALRLIEGAPALHVVAVGKPFEQGDANDKPVPPVQIGSTVVVQSSNHLQTVAVVDLHVRDQSFSFQDGTGLDGAPKPAPTMGSYFRTSTVDITVDLGRDESIYSSMLEYYGKVNEHNRTTFADRKAPPPGPDGNRYVGIDTCSTCHAGAREVWKKTAHARAYKTLSDQHKEFNLDCVSCHVTGYGKPGGSTVTDNQFLQNVQCESCHGPGKLHTENPMDKARIIAKPAAESCVSGCHHPPHVDHFDAVARMAGILGPGHGKK